ncbi:MAG: hypothetical protein ACK481_02280 [Candidatus Melainabacteria bacterium]|jgi:hypothetical protein
MNTINPENNNFDSVQSNKDPDEWSLDTIGKDKKSLPNRAKYHADYIYPVGAFIALLVTLALFSLK